MQTKLQGGNLLNLVDGSLTTVDVIVDDVTGKVAAIGENLGHVDEVIQLNGEVLLPGFVDLHVHLRDPGFTDKETIATGAAAAAAGGFTQIACMPNTNPPLDSPAQLDYVTQRSREAGAARVLPIACITERQEGNTLTDFERLKCSGAVALSDDGKGVQDGGLMREALIQAKKAGLPVAIHAEDESISGPGVLNEGAAKRLGLPAIPGAAESAMIARDILLAEETGAHIHICHVSVESAVALVRFAKERGVSITAEVTPHHLLLSDDLITADDGNFKVNPPLRSQRDKEACLRGFLDGTLDVVATDHAPHTESEKAQGIKKAPFGLVGIETVFPLLYTYLVVPGLMSLSELVKRMSTLPSQAFGLPGGVIRAGGPADIAVVDLETERDILPENFLSKGRNTPFANWRASGWTKLTIQGGRVVFRDSMAKATVGE
ncbi:dihydroorotase [Alicyclobacillus sp. SO9]|uniref:dihydroorotase n=1 Tax=Alicyclobacillus sp. SO9 TaxID=2665646 RepID=UPI001E35C3EE|nr:dihydroorotase [Alicyclobacillus sp. SO9]